MSLLLDALKRAAEQKAAKSRKQDPESGDPDGAAPAGDEDGLPRHALEDETVLRDDTETDARRERAPGGAEDDTETRLESPDSTYTRTRLAQGRQRDRDDETVILTEDEATEYHVSGATSKARADDDETQLTQFATEDQTSLTSRRSERTAQPASEETQIHVPESEETTHSDPSRTAGDESADSPAGAETESARSRSRPYPDETSIDIPEMPGDVTEHRSRAPRADETRIDLPEETSLDETGSRKSSPRADETTIDIPPTEDETGMRRPVPRADETRIDLPEETQTRAERTAAGRPASRADETTIDIPPVDDETGFGESAPRAEETATDVPPATRAEETRSDLPPSSDDKTDISIPTTRADQVEVGEARPGVEPAEPTGPTGGGFEEDDTGPAEDMSLLLVDRDPTQFTSMTSPTDPQQPLDALRAMQESPSGDDHLGLVDTTRHRIPAEGVLGQERSGDGTATTGLSDDTRTARHDMTRADMTSTHTYAPDNYDRTLMRLPSDGATRLFAGMKSESDAVMTPDYAKQVFRSKSSVQRLQHYKAYGGIVVLILLVIGVYGVFEYLEESDTIEASLRPLKKDPMPGIIRPLSEQKSAEKFPPGQIDERAREIIEQADTILSEDPVTPAEAAVTGEGAEQIEQSQQTVATGGASESEAAAQETPTPAGEDRMQVAGGAPAQAGGASAAADEASAADRAQASTAQRAEPKTAESAFSIVTSSQASRDQTAQVSTSNLQIETGSRLERKQVLLREAYQAYLAGNDELALERYNEVLAMEPGNRNALLARAAIRIQNGEIGEAIEDYQALLLANPKDSLAMSSLIAVANYSPRETETRLKLMIREEPGSPYLNFALANVYGAQKRWQEAQGHYFVALQNNPEDPNYAYNLAVSLEHIAQPAAAASYYRRALDNYGKGLATFSKEIVVSRLETLGQP